MVSFVASQSYKRDGTACTDMHAANTEKTTKISDVQNNGSLYFLGTTPINLRKLCIPLEGNDSHSLRQVFSCGFRLQYMGPRKLQRSDNLLSLYDPGNAQKVKTKNQRELCFETIDWPL